MKGNPVPYGVRDDFDYREGEDPRGFTEEENKLWSKAKSEDEREVVMQLRDERRLREHEEQERQAWGTTRAGQLLKQLGACFEAYRQCLIEDPELQEKALEFDEVNQKIFNKMKSTIDRANSAPRCRYPRGNGETCRAGREGSASGRGGGAGGGCVGGGGGPTPVWVWGGGGESDWCFPPPPTR